MTYQETLDFLYQQLPMFSRIGSAAYKKDLTNTLALCDYFGIPQHKFKSIHIGGTNGKGSTTNYLASMFVETGMKVGIYTSPHLIDFRERIKTGNRMISQEFVIEFVEKAKPVIEKIQPSFFELTVVMAFEYFAYEKVDIAMIEVGLGGRLDSTNVILPELCVITNVSFDHMNMLGNTIEEIAFEKAGIIKNGIPCIIGESNSNYNTVFEAKAKENEVQLYYASDEVKVTEIDSLALEFVCHEHKLRLDKTKAFPPYQIKNIKTAMLAFSTYMKDRVNISDFIQKGIAHRTENTGFLGRWTKLKLGEKTIILESAHNEAGIEELKKAIEAEQLKNAVVLFGCVRDKDVTTVISHLPKNLDYILSQANIPRAMSVEELVPLFIKNCNTPIYQTSDLEEALDFAINRHNNKTILVTGSIFLVGEALGLLKKLDY
ncbi:MAG: bifunctional folylpolyglutamate synthase/dihydrofolate synthase [Chitinophagales bacterium]|nr:bifunctional folylpolyglutamate synthase/dihydrofolate synthase [Chitinophagales bacterium]